MEGKVSVKHWIVVDNDNNNNDNDSQMDGWMDELEKWGIVQPDRTVSLTLTPEFHKGVRGAIGSLDSSPWISLSPLAARKLAKESNAKYVPVTLEDLERHTQTQWDSVLHFLVGTPNLEREPPPAVVHFLLQTGLMQNDPDWRGGSDQAPLVITQKGYDFMLQDNHQQVWHFVVQYLKSLEGHRKHKELLQEAMLFLISLSYGKVGDAYAASSLSKRGRVLMKDLSLFGLLYVQHLGDKLSLFYPTRIALQLVQESSSTSSTSSNTLWSLSTKTLESALAHPTPHDSSHLAIIAQTNFQICAYTTSELHVSMLGLFCDVQTIRRLPNVVFMIITRDSVKSAFGLGIQAEQILRFLEKHAHPKLRSSSGGSPIPQNVEDQIWLWDREQSRVVWSEVWMHQCQMRGEFAAIQEFAEKIGGHAWSSEAKRQILVHYSKAEEVQAFVRKWRAKAAADAV